MSKWIISTYIHTAHALHIVTYWCTQTHTLTHTASLGSALMRAVTFRKCQAACQTDKQCQSLSSKGSSHPRTMENTQYTREAGWGRWHTHTHTHTKNDVWKAIIASLTGAKQHRQVTRAALGGKTGSVMRLSVSVVIFSPRWWRCAARSGSRVCLLFAGGDSFFMGLCFFCVFFYSDAVNVNVERSNGAASRPHKERGNRISPSGERSKTKLFFFFF